MEEYAEKMALRCEHSKTEYRTHLVLTYSHNNKYEKVKSVYYNLLYVY